MSTNFTLWFDHKDEKTDPYYKMLVGVTNESIHVQTLDGEFFLPMDDIVRAVLEQGTPNED